VDHRAIPVGHVAGTVHLAIHRAIPVHSADHRANLGGPLVKVEVPAVSIVGKVNGSRLSVIERQLMV